MKLSAWRDDVDIDDAELLISKIGLDNESLWRETEPYLLRGRELKARLAFEDLTQDNK